MSHFDHTFINEQERDKLPIKTLIYGRDKLISAVARYGIAPVEIAKFVEDINFAEDCMHWLDDCWDHTCVLFPTISEDKKQEDS